MTSREPSLSRRNNAYLRQITDGDEREIFHRPVEALSPLCQSPQQAPDPISNLQRHRQCVLNIGSQQLKPRAPSEKCRYTSPVEPLELPCPAPSIEQPTFPVQNGQERYLHGLCPSWKFYQLRFRAPVPVYIYYVPGGIQHCPSVFNVPCHGYVQDELSRNCTCGQYRTRYSCFKQER